MFTTVFLIILVFTIFKYPLDWLFKKIKGVDWGKIAKEAWQIIVCYSKSAGRAATKVVLTLYYILINGDLSTKEKTIVYAAIIYIAVPRDFLPKSVFGWLGVLDDAGAAAFVYAKVKNHITDEVERKVEDTLNKWFGPEIVTDRIADLSQKL